MPYWPWVGNGGTDIGVLLCRDYKVIILGLYWDCKVIMLGLYWDYIMPVVALDTTM